MNGKAVLVKSAWQAVDQVPAPGTAINPQDDVTLKVDRFKQTGQPDPTEPPQQRQDEQQDEPKSEEPEQKRSEQPGPRTDPQYRTCAEANAHGLGPYRRGVDPEYSWYQDRDGDGVVCEPR